MKSKLLWGVALITLAAQSALANPYAKVSVGANADNLGLTTLTPTNYSIAVGNDVSPTLGMEVELVKTRKSLGSALNANVIVSPFTNKNFTPFVGVGVGVVDMGKEAFAYNLRAGAAVPLVDNLSLSVAWVYTTTPNFAVNNKDFQQNTVSVAFKKSF